MRRAKNFGPGQTVRPMERAIKPGNISDAHPGFHFFAGCPGLTGRLFSRLLQLKLKNWAKNIDFFMFLAYFLCFWYVHMKVYMV
ncbi:MAG: hypothetical protein C6W57_04635 [Caldibacillus debilis]|nr:MAG: hypothetical protein C6W57_04635 [Caldibacillus debilis]